MKRAVLIALSLVVIVATAVLAGKPGPPPPSGPRDLVYGSETNVSGDLTLVQASGADGYVVYTAPEHPHYPRFPDWSHDGKYISFNYYSLEGRVLQVATGKTCTLYGSHGTSPQSMEFHPSFGEGIGDGHYVVAFTNWNNQAYDLYFVEFKFQEGTCAVQWSGNVTGADVGEWGAAWSPLGTAQSTQLATMLHTGLYEARLRIYDVVADANGHLALAGTYVDYELDSSLYYPAGFGGGTGASVQWSPDPNRLGILAKWSPDGGTTKYSDVYEIDISTYPPVMTNLTNTAADELYFDFRANGDGIVAGNTEGIWLFPAYGDPVRVAAPGRKKWPRDPAWNPTRW